MRHVIAASSVFLALACQPAGAANCWSLLASPNWPGIKQSIDTLKLCEQLPAGPNRTDHLNVTRFDICSDAAGVTINTEADLRCKTSGGAFIKTAIDGSAKVDVTVDVGACQITNSNVVLGGALGKALTSLGGSQAFIRDWAQGQLSHFCGK